MRTLCVAGVYPWPADDGYRQRLSQMITALGEAGEVDVLSYGVTTDRDGPPPPDLHLLRVERVRVSAADRARRWVRNGLPRAMMVSDPDVVPDVAREWVADRRYDVVYFSHIHSWLVYRDLVDAPAIVDFDNLDHLVIRAARRQRPTGAGFGAHARWLARQPIDRIDEGRMRRLEVRSAATVDAVTLCSSLDVERLGARNAFVVANGYERTRDAPAARPGTDLLFVGALGYIPNADAARWFVREVFPLIRADRPEARVRVVGGGEGAIRDLASIDGVEVLGRVPDIATELDRATLSVVPIRSGSGTRLKVVEALANRLPIVSTTIGVEGIDVVDGRHALLADDAESFALACLRLLDEPALRSAMADEGEALWKERYRWTSIRGDLVRLVRDVARRGARSQTPETESRTTAGE